jgi:uncharacterized integral membrane protein
VKTTTKNNKTLSQKGKKWSCWPVLLLSLLLLLLLLLFVVLGFVMGFFEIQSHKLFACAGFEPQAP